MCCPARDGDANVTRTTSPRCTKVTGRSPSVTAVTVIPVVAEVPPALACPDSAPAPPRPTQGSPGSVAGGPLGARPAQIKIDSGDAGLGQIEIDHFLHADLVGAVAEHHVEGVVGDPDPGLARIGVLRAGPVHAHQQRAQRDRGGRHPTSHPIRSALQGISRLAVKPLVEYASAEGGGQRKAGAIASRVSAGRLGCRAAWEVWRWAVSS